MPFWTMDSVLVSMLEVASSMISTGGSATAARAMAISCRCPWDSPDPSPARTVWYPSGSTRMKLSALASFAAAMHSSSEASWRP